MSPSNSDEAELFIAVDIARVVPLDRRDAGFALERTEPGEIASIAAIRDNVGFRAGFDIRLIKVVILIRWLFEPKLELVCCCCWDLAFGDDDVDFD